MLNVNVTVLYLPDIGILYRKVIGGKATLAYPFKTILMLISDNYQVLIGAIIISALQIRKLVERVFKSDQDQIASKLKSNTHSPKIIQAI